MPRLDIHGIFVNGYNIDTTARPRSESSLLSSFFLDAVTSKRLTQIRLAGVCWASPHVCRCRVHVCACVYGVRVSTSIS